MARAKPAFRQRDVTRALKAALKAGLKVDRLEIDGDGKIVVVPVSGESHATIQLRGNEWDSI